MQNTIPEKKRKEKTKTVAKPVNIEEAEIVKEDPSFAVIEINGIQEKVSPNSTFTMNRITDELLKSVKVLFYSNNKVVKVGNPYLTDVKIELTKFIDKKSTKLNIYDYKAKSRYRKHRGHRQLLSIVKVEKLSL